MREFVARQLADGRPGRASVIGARRRSDPASAALLNGTAGTWVDMNEGNLHARGHPGIQVVPLAWALAEQEGRSGRDLLAAFVVGYEVSARIKRASATRLAVHPHGTFGTIGAAVALARLLGYDTAATRADHQRERHPRRGGQPPRAHDRRHRAQRLHRSQRLDGMAGAHAGAERVHGRARRRRLRVRRDLRRSLRPRGGGGRPRRGVLVAARVHQGPRLRALHPRGARLHRDLDGPAPAPAGVHPRHPRADLRHGGQPRPRRRPVGVRRSVLAALRRGVAPLSRPVGPRQLRGGRRGRPADPGAGAPRGGGGGSRLHPRLSRAPADGGGGGSRRRHGDCWSGRTFTGARPSTRIHPTPYGGSSSTWPRRCGAARGRRLSTIACSTSSACPTSRPWPGTRDCSGAPYAAFECVPDVAVLAGDAGL